MQKINVIAFGGLGGNLFSAGLKTILMRLTGEPGIDFKTFEQYTSWKQWGATLQSWRDPTIVMGHSFGVTAMFGAVRTMGSEGPQIPLAISFDPSQWWGWQASLWGSGGNVAPDRIAKVINFYQDSGLIGRQRIARANGSVFGIQNRQVIGVIHGTIEDHRLSQDYAIDAIKSVIASLNPQPKAA